MSWTTNYILFIGFQTLELFQSRKGRYGNPSVVTTVITWRPVHMIVFLFWKRNSKIDGCYDNTSFIWYKAGIPIGTSTHNKNPEKSIKSNDCASSSFTHVQNMVSERENTPENCMLEVFYYTSAFSFDGNFTRYWTVTHAQA